MKAVNEKLWVHTALGKAPKWIRDHAAHKGKDCLPWPFSRDKSYGRGRIGRKVGGRTDLHWAHRLMCEYVKGPPPTTKHQAAHNCGNGHLACVNPNHLEWKTNTQNQLDRTLHGTQHPRGQPRNKLSADQIASIRALRHEKTQIQLAEMFRVKRGTIEYWLRREADPVPLSSRPIAIRRRLAA